MKVAWAILLISALTDFLIAAGTALTASMVESQTGQLPSRSTMLVAAVGGIVALARTIQQQLKATMTAEELAAGLRGSKADVITKVETRPLPTGGTAVTTVTETPPVAPVVAGQPLKGPVTP